MTNESELKIICETEHARLVQRNGWTFVQRTTNSGIVCIVPCTRDDKIVFVEQFRPPVDKRVIELPAGLAGDSEEFANESLETAARRELLEETGFSAGQLLPLTTLVSSGGITDELVTFFAARDLERRNAGGGDVSEDIEVHVIEREDVAGWLHQQGQRDRLIDAKVYAGLQLLEYCEP